MQDFPQHMQPMNKSIKQEPMEEVLYVQTMTEGEPQEEPEYPPLEPMTEVMTIQNVKPEWIKFKEEPEDVDDFFEEEMQSTGGFIHDDRTITMQEESDGSLTSASCEKESDPGINSGGNKSCRSSTDFSGLSNSFNECTPKSLYNTDITDKQNMKPSQEDGLSINQNVCNTVIKSSVKELSPSKTIKCEECGKCFTQRNHLSNHLKIHFGEKPHKCEECGKCYSRRDHLVRHIKTHSGVKKPHKCEECGKCFSRRDLLSNHFRIHARARTYKCKECGFSVTKRRTFAAHIKKHDSDQTHKCEECGKCFTRKGSLLNHLKFHTGSMPHKCEKCGKCFTFLGALLYHLKNHPGAIPHKCEKCGKWFLHRHALIDHLREHSSEKTA